ncbi:CU044_2847 family protein [Streptomyces broussonetiae]|uniref:CU044_2847 family protein n=1 Tax=Streptomyces broussonetiae TaxID=2686304 RepID=UPI001E488308|nr:CU044_2847 family protein [Streptomyces broussonetiae]
MAAGVERIRLDDGTVVWARIGAGSESGYEGGYADTSLGDRVIDMAGGLAGTVGGVVRSLRAGLDTPAPVEVSVSFGIELTAQSGKIVSAIAEGGGKSSLTVSLSWTEPATVAGGTDPAMPAGPAVPPQATAPGAE